jgi:hypothetical protein
MSLLQRFERSSIQIGKGPKPDPRQPPGDEVRVKDFRAEDSDLERTGGSMQDSPEKKSSPEEPEE